MYIHMCTYTYKVKIFKRNEINILKNIKVIGKNASDDSYIMQEKIQYQLYDMKQAGIHSRFLHLLRFS